VAIFLGLTIQTEPNEESEKEKVKVKKGDWELEADGAIKDTP